MHISEITVLKSCCDIILVLVCIAVIFFFIFHWQYSPLWAVACRTTSFHFFLSATNSLHLLTPSTSSSIGTTAHCGLWPVEQRPSIFSYLPPTLSIFLLPALKISFYFLFPSFPGSSPSSHPFQFLSEDLFGHSILHSL